VSIEVRSLIRRMSVENPLCGAPRIHGELLKLGIEVAKSTVAKYMAKHRPGGNCHVNAVTDFSAFARAC